MTAKRELIGRPQASAESVDDLVHRALRGEIRIPSFQRGLKWKIDDVVDLFDSIYRGYPIGSLLVRAGHADASPLAIGPIEAFGEESGRAWWVVDGQQRLTALAAGLGRTLPFPETIDPYAVYFDPMTRSFCPPPVTGKLATHWVPLPLLLDAGVLQDWIYAWPHHSDTDLRRAVFDAGKRLREYRVPIYLIDTDDDEVLRSIFHRVNNSGQPLKWNEVHDALYSHRGTEPSSLAELSARLEEVGMGRPQENAHLLPCLLAYRGLDVTRSLGEHLREDPRVLDGIVEASFPVIREALGFLRARAGIPHLRLLPYSTPLVVLTRFFQQHRSPGERSLILLVRWVWRSFLAADHDDRATKRGGVASISTDEEGSIQELLKLVPDHASPWSALSDQYDARSAHSRIVLLAMAALQPANLTDGSRIDAGAEIRAHDADAFRPLFPLHGGASRSPANHILLPGSGSAAAELRTFIASSGVGDPLLRSHAITPDVAQAIVDRDETRAIELRSALLVQAVNRLGEQLAEWGRSDRPSIQYVLELGARP